MKPENLRPVCGKAGAAVVNRVDSRTANKNSLRAHQDTIQNRTCILENQEIEDQID